MRRYLQVRKQPSSERLQKKLPKPAFVPPPEVFATSQMCTVQIRAGNLRPIEWHIGLTRNAIKFEAKRIAVAVRRWLKKRYGEVIHFISVNGDNQIRYSFNLKRRRDDIQRVLMKSLPQFN